MVSEGSLRSKVCCHLFLVAFNLESIDFIDEIKQPLLLFVINPCYLLLAFGRVTYLIAENKKINAERMKVKTKLTDFVPRGFFDREFRGEQ